jgi:hypothetical protein
MSLSLLTHNTNHNLSLFPQSEAVVCRSFLDSLSPLFKECRLSVITPWWASFVSVENVMLTKCKYDIRGHLSSCQARAGLFICLIFWSQLEKMGVCPRHALGKEWRPLPLFVRVSIQLIHPKRKK